jgi:membrane associated rhomboid family serine protease
MTPTPVGMRCPECSNQRTRVVRNPTGAPSGLGAHLAAYPATVILIAINVAVYLIEIAQGPGGINDPSARVLENFGLFGPFISIEHEYYRLLTSGFLHFGIFHIGLNMLVLFMVGRLLEPAVGTLRFTVLYFASLFAGSLGALILDPNSLSAGASGAIFGVFGATFIVARGRQLDQVARSVGILIVFNLIYSVSSPEISIGAHVGGLVGGVLCGLLISAAERGRLGRMTGTDRLAVEIAGMVAIGVLSILLSLAVA